MKVIKSTVAMVLSLSLLSTSCMTSKCSATQEATNTESTASKGKDILINQQSGISFNNQAIEKLLNEKFEQQQQQWQQWQQQQEEKEEKDKDSNYKEKVIYMAVGTVIGVLVPLILKGTIKIGTISGKWAWRSGNRLLFGGYNSLKDSKDNLKKVLSSSSNEIIYGQEKAKEKINTYIMNSLKSIDKSKKTYGNVIYIIGPSGTGKTTIATAVADAILKNSQESLLLIDTSSIDIKKNLGDQLFKVFSAKDVKSEDENLGIFEKGKKSPIYAHIEKWEKAVVIIDDYDKMKMLPSNQFSSNNKENANEDRTADEILKSIADKGKYYIDGQEVDCSKAIFIVTSNETKEELKMNFGVGGEDGGGLQRLNLVEFEPLSFEACQQIIKRMLYNIM